MTSNPTFLIAGATRDGPDATATALARDVVQLSGARELRSGVTVWTAGFGVQDLASRSRLSTDALARLLTDETLTSADGQQDRLSKQALAA